MEMKMHADRIDLMTRSLLICLAALLMSVGAEPAGAATPVGFASTVLNLNAQVNIACQEAQHGVFPGPLLIDTLSPTDQTFAPSADETVYCTSGTVFTIKVTSTNGTAMNQNCTSTGVSGMALKSASAPSDTISYLFLCAGDTDGSGNFTGAGFISPRALGIGIKVPAAAAQSAVAHADYSDTVTLTISY